MYNSNSHLRLLCTFVLCILSSCLYGEKIEAFKEPCYSIKDDNSYPAKKIISKCNRIVFGYMEINNEPGDMDCISVSRIGGPVEDYGIYNCKPLKIIISSDKILLSQADTSLIIRFFGITDNGYKQYELSGSNFDGISFRKLITANEKCSQAIDFYDHSRWTVSKPSYHLAYENMEDDTPLLLEVVKKWVTKWPKSFISYE